jgi:adenylate cyclase
MPEEVRRLAAIMFTDMVGYTALTQSNEAGAMKLLEKHNQLLRPFFPKFRGREVKTIGDSFLVEFDSALDALRCAEEIQEFLHDQNIGVDRSERIVLRIGVHLGDVIHRDGDILGDAVNISSRLQPLAEPGGICISRQVYDQVHNKFDLPLSSLGEKGLKNVSSPTEVYRVQLPWETQGRAESSDSRRVAVLPFSNMSPDPADEFFADGLTEELISTVSHIEGTEVISRTSVMQYKKSPKPIRQISSELDAGTVLEGSVRKAGNRLRVTVQMIDAAKDRHLWAESYDRNLDDVFAIQSDIAGRVADALRTRMSTTSPATAGGTENAEAYSSYLRAMSQYHEGAEGTKEAIRLLESATAKDRSFAKAYALLAECYRHMGHVSDYSSSIAKAEEAAKRALELSPESAESHAAMASVHMALDRFKEARKELEEAVRICPNLSDAYRLLAEVTGAFGQLQECEAYYRRAYALDPLSSQVAILLSIVLNYEGRYDEAFQILFRQRELYPNNVMVRDALIGVYMQKGDNAAALKALEEGLKETPDNLMLRSDNAIYYAVNGDREKAEAALDEMKSVDAGTNATLNAEFYVRAALGDYDRAFVVLDRLAELHSWIFLIKTDPMLAELRKDPRFAKFCLKVGIPP